MLYFAYRLCYLACSLYLVDVSVIFCNEMMTIQGFFFSLPLSIILSGIIRPLVCTVLAITCHLCIEQEAVISSEETALASWLSQSSSVSPHTYSSGPVSCVWVVGNRVTSLLHKYAQTHIDAHKHTHTC